MEGELRALKACPNIGEREKSCAARALKVVGEALPEKRGRDFAPAGDYVRMTASFDGDEMRCTVYAKNGCHGTVTVDMGAGEVKTAMRIGMALANAKGGKE